MADTKLTGLPAAASALDTDLLYVVADPAGTPTGKKIPVASLFAGRSSGGGGGGGALVLLASLTAAASATLDFATRNATGQSGALFQSDYDEYVIEIVNLQNALNTQDLFMRVTTDGGATSVADGNYFHTGWSVTFSGATSAPNGAGLNAWTVYNAADSGQDGVCGTIRVFGPLASTFRKRAITSISGNTTSASSINNGVLLWNVNTPINGLRVFFGSGNIASGSVRVYGIAKTGAAASLPTRTLTFTIDGGGAVPATGIKGDISVPYACTINSVRLLADQSGSAVVDIWKDTYANYPPTIADKITASAPPTLASAAKNEDLTLTGWTKTVAAGDILRFNLNSIATITRLMVVLTVIG